MAMLMCYDSFVGIFLCFIRLLIFASSGPRPLNFGAICYVLFVCYCLRAAARARSILGPCLCFFRLDPSLSHSRRVASKDEQYHETP
jgi:hypothetical protein